MTDNEFERLQHIRNRIAKLPPTPWSALYGNGHVEVYGSDSTCIMNTPNIDLSEQLIDFLVSSKYDIEFLLELVDKRLDVQHLMDALGTWKDE